MAHEHTVDVHDSPDSSALGDEAAKRINSSSEENVPFMDSEGKFGKRYKVCGLCSLPCCYGGH